MQRRWGAKGRGKLLFSKHHLIIQKQEKKAGKELEVPRVFLIVA